MRKQNKEIQLTSYDDLLGIEEERTDNVMEVSLSELYSFKEHPFQVRDDEKMEETVDSIKNYGVLIPGLVTWILESPNDNLIQKVLKPLKISISEHIIVELNLVMCYNKENS